LPGQVGSVERAIVLLGLNAVKNMAVAASLGQLFRRVKLYDGADAKDLWRHCVAVAIVARELAIKAKLPVGDEAFLAGMIHDAGILVELQSWPEQLRAVCQNVATSDLDFCQTEREKLGVDHQLLGRALAEHWKFPKTCQEVAGCHHNPSEADASAATLVRLIHTADTICCQKGEGFSLTARHQELDATALQALGVTNEMIAAAVADLPLKVSTAMSDLG
jgi:HD-like signal output (HDOD) protein